MAAPISLRLDPETRNRVERIARRKKVPPSYILREAVTKWVEHEEESISPYEAVQDLIGIAREPSAPVTLSENTGRRFTELLQARRRKR